MNGCTYVFYAGTVTLSYTHGTFDIKCPSGKEIKVEVTGLGESKEVKCTVDIPPQTGIKVVQYTNLGMGASREVTVLVASSSIKYTQTKGTGIGACANTGLESNGFYSGTTTMKGETDPGSTQTGIWIG